MSIFNGLGLFGGFAFLGTFISIVYFGFLIYLLVLMIKLATRGIKALDIYIEKNRKY